jgi:hypothetical protein
LLLTAASALCWTIWLTRNEVVFDKCRPKFFLQVLFRGTYWLWACDNGRSCSGVRCYGINFYVQSSVWRHQPFRSLVPMGGFQIIFFG